MARRDRYVALVASLPSSERLFFAKQPPLSRLRLDRRLSLLTEADAAVLRVVEELLSWRAYAMATTGEEARARADRAIAAIPQPTLRTIVLERLDMRYLVAALRLRARGAAAPNDANALGRLTPRLAQNWGERDFKLGRRFPWLSKAAELHQQGDPRGLERHILEVAARHLQRRAEGHHFDFEAVAIYVLKWNIFDRWSRLNTEAASRRFNDLATAALADFPELNGNGGADVDFR